MPISHPSRTGLVTFTAMATVLVSLATAAGVGANASTATAFPAQPGWVGLMINGHNLSNTSESIWVTGAASAYKDCAAQGASATPNWAVLDNYIIELKGALGPHFLVYAHQLPGWIRNIGKLKSTPALARAKAKLTTALNLHQKEDGAWIAALAALKAHNCNAFLTDIRAAENAGRPAWVADIAGTLALAGVYGQTGRVTRVAPYAMKV